MVLKNLFGRGKKEENPEEKVIDPKKRLIKLEKELGRLSLTEQEAINIMRSARSKPTDTPTLSFAKKHMKYGYFADPHVGHESFLEPLFNKMKKAYADEGVDFILCPGDHLEGMSNRPGHVYELNKIGFKEQINYASGLYNELPDVPIFGIDGNHDQWYFKPQNMGIVVGEELEKRVKNYKHLGQDEGDIEIDDGLIIKLYHANDGTAYADSYKLQKLIESFTGGEKPDIVHSGHYHKQIYIFRRNVHAFECGSLCDQTKWMRGKKIPAQVGFGIVEVWYNKKGVDKLRQEFFPYYVPIKEAYKLKDKR